MATLPVICFNSTPAEANDYFNHDQIHSDVGLFNTSSDSLRVGEVSEINHLYLTHNHSDEITDVKFYILPYTGSTTAEIISTNTETFDITSSNNTFILKLDERTFSYTITLTIGSTQSAQDICDDINNTINEIVAYVESGAIKLVSPSRGLTSKIYIYSTGNTANSVLGFTGDDSNPVAVGTVGNWGLRGNGSHGKSVGSAVTYPLTITFGVNDQFNISLNYSTSVECTIAAGTINNDTEFSSAINNALVSAGFSLTTDVSSSVSSNVLTITSVSTEDNSFVEITPGTNDATSTIGMSNPVETSSSYANKDAVSDFNELISWGDDSYGLEFGENTSNFTRVMTGVCDSSANALMLNWGDGTTLADIAKFDYSGGDTKGEIECLIRLSVPPTETETGFREWSLAVEFTYI